MNYGSRDGTGDFTTETTEVGSFKKNAHLCDCSKTFIRERLGVKSFAFFMERKQKSFF